MTPKEKRWKRKHRRLEKALMQAGAVPKVKMQAADGSWVFGVFIPFTREEMRAEREVARKRSRARLPISAEQEGSPMYPPGHVRSQLKPISFTIPGRRP